MKEVRRLPLAAMISWYRTFHGCYKRFSRRFALPAGFKLWEGAQDLMDIIVHQFEGPWTSQAGSAALSCIDGCMLAMLPSSLQGTRVLELGCGHGLPGILCMLAGAEVFFHVRTQCRAGINLMHPPQA